MKAKIQYEQAIEQNPELHQAYYNLALVNINLKEENEAKKLVKKAIELDPSNESYKKLLKELESTVD